MLVLLVLAHGGRGAWLAVKERRGIIGGLMRHVLAGDKRSKRQERKGRGVPGKLGPCLSSRYVRAACEVLGCVCRVRNAAENG